MAAKRRRNSRVVTTQIDPAALAAAKRAAGGNAARVRIQRDGTVFIKNRDESDAARERRALGMEN